MKEFIQSNYLLAFKELFIRISKLKQKQFGLLLVGMICVALLETFTMGVIAIFASIITDPSVVMKSKYIVFVRNFCKFKFLYSITDVTISIAIIMVIATMVKNCFKAFITYSSARFSVSTETYFGEFLLKGFLNVPYEWHLSQNSADTVNAILWRHHIGRGFFIPTLQIFNDIFMVVVMLSTLLIIQPFVSLTIITILGATAYFIYFVIRRRLDRVSTIAKNYQLAINRDATLVVHGVKDVKLSSKENSFIKRFLDNAVPSAKIAGLQQFFGSAPVLILETVGLTMLAGLICLMLFLSKDSTAVVTGTMALLAVTIWRVLPAVSRILAGFAKMRAALPYISNQLGYINFIESNNVFQSTPATKDVSSHKKNNKIVFDNVSFKYENSKENVLKGVDFSLPKGSTTGIIGASGGGKSTIVDLMTGLLTPSKGQILIDNSILTSDNHYSWLKNIGYVSQAPYIFDGTLAENIAFGCKKEEIDRGKIIQCCKMSSMEEFLSDLPDYIDSFIGERGVRLSGGQQQRVAIARALYSDPDVMIFDEATSSLDTQSEKAIQDTIYSLKGSRTLIIIAHRLSTVEDCDSLIWIEKGSVILKDKPEKVLKSYKEQMKTKVVGFN